MQPWDEAFPVGQFKQALLGKYSQTIGYTLNNYDVSINRHMETIEDLMTLSQNTSYLDVTEVYRLRDTYLKRGLPVFLSIGYPGHAVAYIIQNTTVYIFDTQATETTDAVVDVVREVLDALFEVEFNYVDVLEEFDVDDSFQSEDDNYCVIWMLMIFELSAQYYSIHKTIDFQKLVDFLDNLCEKRGACLYVAQDQYERYMKIASGQPAGGRRRKQKSRKNLKRKSQSRRRGRRD